MKSAAVYLRLIAQILQLTINLCISMKLQILKNGIINKLENKTLSGIDGIYNIMVKLSATVVVRFLKHLINISFPARIFPRILKYKKVLPLHKGG